MHMCCILNHSSLINIPRAPITVALSLRSGISVGTYHLEERTANKSSWKYPLWRLQWGTRLWNRDRSSWFPLEWSGSPCRVPPSCPAGNAGVFPNPQVPSLQHACVAWNGVDETRKKGYLIMRVSTSCVADAPHHCGRIRWILREMDNKAERYGPDRSRRVGTMKRLTCRYFKGTYGMCLFVCAWWGSERMCCLGLYVREFK